MRNARAAQRKRGALAAQATMLACPILMCLAGT
jgi:hypothetical protein